MATLYDFGIKSLSKEIDKRGGKIPQFMLKQNGYAGKQLYYKNQLFTCIESTTNTVVINYNNEKIRVNRKEILAPKNTIPVYKRKTEKELLEEIKLKYPNATLSIPKTGCQLHGDIDATLTIKDKSYTIPWNY